MLPPLGEREFQSLKESIERESMLSPIIVNDKGVILDGHQRYRACQQLDIEPRFEVRAFPDPLLEKIFVIETNVNRRHLNDFQKVEASLQILELERKHAKLRIGEGRSPIPETSVPSLASYDARVGKATEIVARRIGVSPSSYERALAVIERAPETLKNEARNGKKSISKAHLQLRTIEYRNNIESTPVPNSVNLDIRLGDFRGGDLQDSSVDLILTDPPYRKEYLGIWKDLGTLGKRVLKPGGWLLSYAPNASLPLVMNSLSASLHYQWTMGVHLSGNHERWKNFFIDWRPVLVYYKPPFRRTNRPIADLLTNAKKDKSFHDWGQGIRPFIALTEAFSRPGDLVLEPFAGGGTTVQACAETKRNCIAYEIDPGCYELLRRRFHGSDCLPNGSPP